jgi:hypothetical protein
LPETPKKKGPNLVSKTCTNPRQQHVSGSFQRLIEGSAAGSTARPDPMQEIQRVSAGCAPVGIRFHSPHCFTTLSERNHHFLSTFLILRGARHDPSSDAKVAPGPLLRRMRKRNLIKCRPRGARAERVVGHPWRSTSHVPMCCWREALPAGGSTAAKGLADPTCANWRRAATRRRLATSSGILGSATQPQPIHGILAYEPSQSLALRAHCCRFQRRRRRPCSAHVFPDSWPFSCAREVQRTGASPLPCPPLSWGCQTVESWTFHPRKSTRGQTRSCPLACA